jgi:hypothetical protein
MRVGKPTSLEMTLNPAASSGLARFIRAENSCASTIPIATPSPWTSRLPSYSGGRFQRMAESVAEIEQRPRTAFTLVGGHHVGLGLATGGDRPDARRAAREHLTPVGSSQAKNSGRSISPYLATSA